MMKLIKTVLLFSLALSFFLASCSDSDDDGGGNPPPEAPTDTEMVIAVTELGGVFEIGYESGQSTSLGQIEGITAFMQATTITASNQFIFGVEYVYDPGPTNRLFIYDRAANTSQSVDLQLPGSFSGEEASIVNMAWSGSTLLCLLNENILLDFAPISILSIDITNNYEVSLLPIDIGADIYSSLVAKPDVAYTSSSMSGIIEIDLVSNTSQQLAPNRNTDGSKLVFAGNNLQFVRIDNQNLFPAQISLDNLSITALPDAIEIPTLMGNGFYDINKTEYLLLSRDATSDPFLALYKADLSSGTASSVAISGSGLTDNMIIVDIEAP